MTYGDYLRNSDDESLARFITILITRTIKKTNEKDYAFFDTEVYFKDALKILKTDIEGD